MAYFDGIKVGDRVWDFVYGWGEVIDIEKDSVYYPLVVEFKAFTGIFNYKGIKIDFTNQTLFWSEILFELPKRPQVKLKEDKYYINVVENKIIQVPLNIIGKEQEIGLTRDDKGTAGKALEQIIRFTKLLALRDQECLDRRS